MRVSVLMILLLISVGVVAQSGWRTFPPKAKPEPQAPANAEGVVADTMKAEIEVPSDTVVGVVQIHAPDSVEILNQEMIENAKINPTIDGYTIQIFSLSGANSRARAHQARVKFEETFPDIRSYVVWKSPNYVVRVGDFRTKLEAEKALRQIKETYPAALVKRARVALPDLEESEDK